MTMTPTTEPRVLIKKTRPAPESPSGAATPVQGDEQGIHGRQQDQGQGQEH